MGCIKLDILERAPSKRSPQIRMGSNCKPITKKGVSTYTFGFQGQEQDNEISGNGNSYTAEFWQYDSRLGRRWNLDPKPQTSISDYACFYNNPLLMTDPLGDKVKFSKDKDVSRKDFRKMKRRVKDMCKNSETFKNMYDDLDSRKEKYYYNATSQEKGESQDPYVINIGLNFTGNTELNAPEPYEHAQMGLIAHETGHIFRSLYNLDPPQPDPALQKTNLKAKDHSNWNTWAVQEQKYHEVSEKGALHIENIVRSELNRRSK